MALVVPAAAGAATITVDTNAGAPTEGACALPDAIKAANGDRKKHGCHRGDGADTIAFDLPGSTVIQPAQQLPDITKRVTIDGTTEPDYAGVPIVDIDEGAMAVTGLEPTGDHVVIKGLEITDFTFEGLRIDGDHAKVVGNLIGVDSTGADHGNGTGVSLEGSHETVGGRRDGSRNLISGNANGVSSLGDDNLIQGNYIGVAANGSSILPNTFDGVSVSGNGGRVIDNLISGNLGAGINVHGNDALVRGNLLGVNADGTAVRPNSTGIALLGKHALVGGTKARDRNVISGNAGDGVFISNDSGAGRNRVLGNYIGTDASGTADLGNGDDGVQIGSSDRNLIGGDEPKKANVISGNVVGVRIGGFGGDAKRNVVSGNLLGTDRSGQADIGNDSGAVRLFGGARNNLIGGLHGGEGNLMRFTPGGAVSLGGGNADFFNSILGNSASDNGEEVIDLGENGVTPNDLGSPPDADDGPNHLQNFPVLIGGDEQTDHIIGSLDSTPGASFRIEFFTSPESGDAKRFVGAKTITTNGAGHKEITFASSKNLPTGQFVTATATLLDGTKPTDTSELSAAADISVGP